MDRVCVLQRPARKLAELSLSPAELSILSHLEHGGRSIAQRGPERERVKERERERDRERERRGGRGEEGKEGGKVSEYERERGWRGGGGRERELLLLSVYH